LSKLETYLQLNRNAIRIPRMRWPDGRIPYVISTLYDSHSRAVIARAIQEYHEKTCIRFEPKNDSDKNYIYIYPSNGCASQVGLVGGMQIVSIGQGLYRTL
jgi:astacin